MRAADVEEKAQTNRGTRDFIKFVNSQSYQIGLGIILNLPISFSRSTAYDLSERLSYCFILFIHNGMEPLSDQEKKRINKLATYVMRNLEYYGPKWTNNHYLNNARALLCASIMLGDRALANRAVHILQSALATNFPNLFFRERSTSYQCLVQYWLKMIYLGLVLIGGPAHIKKNVLDLVKKNEVKGLNRLNFGDNTPDFSKVNTHSLSQFFDQFLPNFFPVETSNWITFIRKKNFDFAIVTRELEHFGPEHGYRNLACFQMDFKGKPVFIANARSSYNKTLKEFNSKEDVRSSGVMQIDSKAIYTRPTSHYGTDPTSLPYLSDVDCEVSNGSISFVINSSLGPIKEEFSFKDDEVTIKLRHQNICETKMFFLLPEGFRYIDGYLQTVGQKFLLEGSTSLVGIEEKLCRYSDDYGSVKTGMQLVVSFKSSSLGCCSYIKLKESLDGISI